MKDELIKILTEVFAERRLDVLTEIQIGTTNDELNQVCVDLREDVVDGLKLGTTDLWSDFI